MPSPGLAALTAAIVGTVGSGCTLGQGSVQAGGWQRARIDSVTASMPRLLREHAVPGVAIVLVHGSAIQWSAGFGVASGDGNPASPSTTFQVASLGKPVFAYLVDALAQERSWTLEDSIAAWAPSGSYRADLGSLTAAELLSHTSGLVYDSEADRIAVDPQRAGQWQYSGAGYVMLQRVVEASEGSALDALVAAHLLRPLGLAAAGFLRPASGEMAEGHDREGDAGRALTWPTANAASSLHSSALDYARFLIHAAGLGSHTPQSWTRQTAPRVTVREDLGLKWGLGWALEEDASGALTAFHWGSNPGFKSFALVDRQRAIALVALTNGDNGLELIEDLLTVLDPKPHPLFRFYMLHPTD